MKAIPKTFPALAGLAVVFLLGVAAAASADEWRTSGWLIRESKYGDNFQRYDYVNPDAPKGGTLNSTVVGTFDSFNPYVVQGSPAAGFSQFGGGLLYDTLMEQAIDEGSVYHPLVAEAYKFPADYSSVTYRLNPAARWHDGQPITVDDVVWSFNVLKANSPMYNRYFENVTEAVAVSDREVEFRFNQKGNRELPNILGDLVVLPKHWWEGTDASGKKRDITKPTLEIPLGSAAYKIKSFKPGSEIIWERVPDYWGAKLPVKVGRENFDTRRYTYFLDESAEWLAFIKGGWQDINPENSGRGWMTKYDFPAIKAGDVIKKEFKAQSRANMQGFAMNTRRPLFQDRRVRQALSYLYDFDTINRTQSFGLNTRITSYFMGSDLASSGLPQGEELELLNQYKDKLPPELFTQEWSLPAFDKPQAERKILKQSVDLLASAGWVIKGSKMVNAKTGAPFRFEILDFRQGAEATMMPYVTMLRKIGIDATLRFVDQSQYVNRLNDFDFDMTTVVLPQSDSPGNEQRDFWSSKAADSPGSRNYEGIKDPVVDALVDKVIFARSRDELTAATHALDRVLLWNFYVVPQFTRPDVWLAYWNKFGIPDKQPTYIGPDIESWWIDPEKEKALAAKYKSVD
ncbi:extracellular solute-binding protein [Ollibium composti]|uniref:ABC transporter substrate-binding protein n=1 Tax=Ollibium composti TaxID=2675109 RepID=A0ABY2Q5H8_9HYPH|nr:extracellular solute-binding protein [Mesorhizobium composti]THF56314.1 ABC transporter substrate-binding protein [Mesorhizobium composti]